MSDDKSTTYQDLAARASALEQKLVKLRQADAPVLLDIDYDACFVKAHQQLTADVKPSPIPRPLLRVKLLETLKNERESLKRVLADHESRLCAAMREIADWKERIDAVTRDAALPAAPSDTHVLRELVTRRQNQIATYLDNAFPQPPMEDQAASTSSGAGDATLHPGSRGYLTLTEFFNDLLAASSQPGDLQYVKLGPQHWLPHVQVLLDSNVAERDPQRSDHIRLMDWG